jgi:hypothetical protein
MEAPRRLGVAEKRQPHPPAPLFGDVLVYSGCCVCASVSPRTLPCASASRQKPSWGLRLQTTTTELLPPSSRPALFRALGNSLRRYCFHRSNLGLPMLCKEIVKRLGEQILNRSVAVSSKDTQLPLHCWRKIARDVALPFSAGPEVRTLGRGRGRVVLLRGRLRYRHLGTGLKRLP